MDKKIGFLGEITEKKLLKIGYIGCGSHSRRNILTALGYVAAEKTAICDLNIEKAELYAKEFGFASFYGSHAEMLEKEDLDAVFIVTGYDPEGRPLYCRLAKDCLNAGLHVWMEKPPAAEVEDLMELKTLAEQKNKLVMTGFKKMFFPANEKAKELLGDDISLALLQYPQYVPAKEEILEYFNRKPVQSVIGFLDHICHPVSLMVYLMGYPKTLQYIRNGRGGAVANFTFENGSIASIALTEGAATNGGMERTTLIGGGYQHIVIDNNIKLSLHRTPEGLGYGNAPSYFKGKPETVTAVWEPEFSLGQLYNNNLFLLGYYGELNEFCSAVTENRPLSKAHLDDAIMITKIFRAFGEDGNRLIEL